MNKEQTKNPDYILMGVVALALVLGVMILSSASASLSQFKHQDSYYLIRHQLLLGILPGIAACLIAYRLPMVFFRRMSPFLILAAVILLVLVFVPKLGFSAGGAQRWIDLGFATIQPSEILKLSFIIYLASWLAARTSRADGKGKTKKEFRNTLAVFLTVVGFIGLLVLKQPDLSTFGIVAVTAFAMYFLAETPLKHTFLMIFAGAALLAVLVIAEPYRLQRLTSWLSPEADPLGKNFQSSQALMMAGSGGVFGQGFGSSSAKYILLPELIGDSVFAPFAQEFGFAGGIMLAAIFAVFAWRGFLIARRSRGKFEYLLAMGVTIWIVLQAMVNISSTIGLIPLSGIPLPFISYGGTAIAIELAAVGILLNISRQSRLGPGI